MTEAMEVTKLLEVSVVETLRPLLLQMSVSVETEGSG